MAGWPQLDAVTIGGMTLDMGWCVGDVAAYVDDGLYEVHWL